MIAFTLIYLALSLGGVDIAIWLLFSTFILILLIFLIINFLGIIKSQKRSGIILSYLMFSFVMIILFGFIFALIGANESNALIWTNQYSTNNSNNMTSWDHIYFSSTSYYANSVGDIQPLGHSKTLMSIETAISFLFHVVILGFLFSDPNYNKK